MKTLIKLIVVAAVLLATWRVGSAYWDHYQFEDAVKDAAQFSERAGPPEITAKVLDIAQRMDIPLDAESVQVTREQRRITIDAAYVRSIELLPRVSRKWEFTVHVSVLAVN